MANRVCLITGVGPGTGAALARRFATGGYRVAMLARDRERLSALAGEIPGAQGFPCDVADAAALEATCAAVGAELGRPQVVIHNAVGGAFGDFQTIDPAVLRQNFEVNTMALLTLARAVAPGMAAAGEGVILCTGNTSAHRGVANFAGFAPSKAAQRILAESIARTLWPRGVHVAYLTIDAVIDLAWTRQMFAGKPDDFFIAPAAIADECWHVAHQPRTAWSFDVQVRPFGERW
jgi:NAD(P)-dependent dehydrogenase (short-subunit alcohol dehydrogenase family)